MKFAKSDYDSHSTQNENSRGEVDIVCPCGKTFKASFPIKERLKSEHEVYIKCPACQGNYRLSVHVYAN